MNIMIPINGKGSRFKEKGFLSPKALINVLGRPMIYRVIESLNINYEDRVFIIYSKELEAYSFEHVVNNFFPDIRLNLIKLNYDTRGAAETVLSGLNKINDESILNDPFVIADGDTFYSEDVLSKYRKNKGNSIFYFKDQGNKDIFSYIDISNKNVIKDIKEKERISNNACTGLYCFESGNTLKRYCEKTINNASMQKGEFYMSSVYREMLLDNKVITPIEVRDFNCVGTPPQLKSFCLKNNDKCESLRFCFDLDNTLVTYPKVKSDYSTIEPIYDSINYLKFLKECGHQIIISTARRMRTHNGNSGKVVADIAKITFETLDKFEIPYDEVYFSKPYADFYIDDLSVNPKSNIDIQVGFYSTKIKERHFNEIIVKDESILKKGQLSGEIYWYKNIPKSIEDLFPRLISSGDGFIELEKINGITLSHGLINCSLTSDTIDGVISRIDRIHGSISPNYFDNNINIYENYNSKLKSRLDNHIEIYRDLDADLSTFNMITSKLQEYERANFGNPVVIHGDPVFTNIISDSKNIFFIDMRGVVGGCPTMWGDSFYDFCKIYQSLCGYDHIIHDSEDIYDLYHLNLKSYFETLIKNRFGEEYISYLKFITSSLFYSMIPLHHDYNNRAKFFQKAKELIEEAK